MRDEDKTKEELIRELQELRQRSENVDTTLEINKEILKHVSEGVLLIQPDSGNILYTTKSLNQMFGYDSGELIGEHAGNLIAFDNTETQNIFCNISHSLEKYGTWKGEVYNQTKGGEHFWTFNRISTFNHTSYGTVWVVIQENISKYKTVENALRENDELLTNIIESMSEGILVLNRNFQYTYWNAAMETISKVCRKDLINSKKRAWEHFPHLAEENVDKTMQKAMQGHVMQRKDIPYRLADGTCGFTIETYLPLKDTTDNIRGVVGVVQDITKQKELENQINQKRKMEALGALAGGIAHDFNNILTALSGNAEMISVQLPADNPLIRHVTEITKGVERATKLVKQILTFSRMKSTCLAPLKLSLIVQDALKMTRALLPASVEIRPHIQESGSHIMADSTQIHQIILNLCTNAYHAMKETVGSIEVSLKEIDDCSSGSIFQNRKWLQLKVKDTGIGISEEDQRKIFNPFFTTKELGKGTGLGLSVVNGIVERHNGTIEVESTLGKGTTFSILFPVTGETSSEEHTLVIPVRHGSGSVLIVDDEQEIVDLYKDYLNNLNYEVTTCGDGKEALDLFKRKPNQFDIVITDQSMPYISGKELAQELLKLEPYLPVILSTGHSDIINKDEAEKLGIRKYLMKPVKLSALQQAIAECLSTGN